MAFLRKKARFPSIMLVIFLIILLIGAVAGGLYHLYEIRLKGLQIYYDEEIQDLKFELYMLERQVFVPKEDIPYGSVLKPELFHRTNMKLSIEQNALLDETDMGRINTVMLPAGIPVVKSTTDHEKVSDDIREQEFNMFLIQTNQKAGDFVDVRIVFPNAENYIVLGKKQLRRLNRAENIICLWLDETEIHNISSAIIDAYLYPGTKIYVTTYVQPQMQEHAVPFYPANIDVMDLMKKDPNILKTASDTLAREARNILESRLDSITAEDGARVSSGVSTEISRTNEFIKQIETDAADEKTDEKYTEGS